MDENQQKMELFEKEKDNFEEEKKVIKKKGLTELLKATFVVILIIFEFGFIGAMLVQYKVIEFDSFSDNKIAVVNFNKVITSKTVQKAMDSIDFAINNEDYKEILFIMNSPGGSPSASEELSQYLKNVKNDKNITMYVEGFALSGGYYIASSIKPLQANPNALLGSIGVIMQYYNLEELAKRWGVEEVALTKGKYKKPFSYFKKLDENMSQYIDRNMLNPMYQNFVEAVAVNRGLTKEKILNYAEGKIFVANSKEIDKILVDKITSLYQIRKDLKKKYGKDVVFENILKSESPMGFLKGKVDVNFNNLQKSQVSY